MTEDSLMRVRSNGNVRQVSMPDELMRFIQQETYSLLIKGEAGTGKTTLALTILLALRSMDNFFYISTRISPRQLFQYFPWLDEFVKESGAPSQGEREGPNRAMLPSFEDARLDEPESLFERITNQLMDIKSPVIIIDSWDAIASFMDKEARLNNERVLQTWRERAGAKLIFISESPDDSTLDYLVDGIVELRQTHYENLRLREIHLLKLRGVRVNRASYIYTLGNTIFRSFEPYMPIELGREPLKKSGNKAGGILLDSDPLSTGHPMLDKALGGGFPKKGIVLLEMDSHVNTTAALALLDELIAAYLSSGNPVLFQPFDWIDPSAIMDHVVNGLPAGKKELFKILWPNNISRLSHNLIIPPLKRSPSLSTVVKMKEKFPNKSLLNIMGMDIIQKSDAKGVGVRSTMEEIMSSARAGDLSIVVARRSQGEFLEYLSEVSHIHLRMLIINDTLFLQSLVPASSLLALIFSGRHVALEPVV